MIVQLAGKVDDKMIATLLEHIQYDCKNIRILFTSSGGSVASMEAILYILKQEGSRIELVGYGYIASSAFMIFFEAACRKSLLPGTVGLAHLQAMDMKMTQAEQPRDRNNQWWYKEMVKEKEQWIERHRVIGLTKKELSLIKKGEDVNFSYSRMLELLTIPDKSIQ